MKTMSPEAKVGLLVLSGLLILIYMSLKVGQVGFGPGGGYVLKLELDSAVGLAKDSEVLVAGIPVGLVEEIKLRQGRALLILRIQDGVELAADSVASLRTQGVLGEKYVEVRPGTGPGRLGDGDPIRPGAPPGDLDQLVTNFNDIASDVKRVAERLSNVLGTPEGEQKLREIVDGLRDVSQGLRDVVTENRDSLRDALVNVRDLTGELREALAANRENLDATLANTREFTGTLAARAPGIADKLETLTGDLGQVVAENRDNLKVGLANLREASGTLTRTLDQVQAIVAGEEGKGGTLGRLLRDDSLYVDLQASAADLRRVVERLDRGEGTLGKLLTDDAAYAELTDSLQHLRSITAKIDQGEGTIGKLVNDEKVHENLNETLDGINEFVSGVNRFEFELGYRGEYLTDFGEGKGYFGLEIRPRPDYFYSFALVDDPRGDSRTKVIESVVTDDSGNQTTTRQEKTTYDKDKLKFSAQVGKRFSFLTLRGGILESSGGVGADVDFWAKRFRLSFEAFDFSREDGPAHLKVWGEYHFLKHLFVSAGVDDFLDDHGRADYFIGGGIRFLDEDIRYLLSPAANAVR